MATRLYAEEPGPVDFLLIYPDAPPPQPAAANAGGSLPVRAVQLCPPVTSASSFGWHLFPPVDFALLWDGQELLWSLLAEDNRPSEWMSLSGGVEGFLPNSARVMEGAREHMRADLVKVFESRGESFINADPRAPNQCEIFPGVCARTGRGWSLLIRGVANWAPPNGHQVLEGIVETEWFRSYLPVIIRVTAQGRMVRFHRRLPFALAQPVPCVAYEARTLQAIRVRRGLAEFTDQDWAEFLAERGRRVGQRRPGSYRRAAALHGRTRRRGNGNGGYTPSVGDEEASLIAVAGHPLGAGAAAGEVAPAATGLGEDTEQVPPQPGLDASTGLPR